MACAHADSLSEVRSHSTLLSPRRPSVWWTLCQNRGGVDRARGYGLVWDRALVCSISVRPGFVSSKRGVESRSRHRCRGRGKGRGHVSSEDSRKAKIRLKIVSLISVYSWICNNWHLQYHNYVRGNIKVQKVQKVTVHCHVLQSDSACFTLTGSHLQCH